LRVNRIYINLVGICTLACIGETWENWGQNICDVIAKRPYGENIEHKSKLCPY